MATPSKARRIAGWALSVLIVVFLCGPSAAGKIVEWDGKAEMMDHLGYSIPLIKKIAVVEIAVALLFLVPRTAFVAAILLTGYLGASDQATDGVGSGV
ncbi:hypothetical protein Pla108_02480 [Botrimarina colliarenosi]|uniref:DoxX n=1 Tax=Botrimarina colliarenosi TaxID=2528001 RepID=A0A5C6AMB3_9BACT|nr:DoxX family protein [Botrimarina colliarenosi]TWT99313.1 hypothetical protein Pla108_02480 [Botrimarina colliarenosi]